MVKITRNLYIARFANKFSAQAVNFVLYLYKSIRQYGRTGTKAGKNKKEAFA